MLQEVVIIISTSNSNAMNFSVKLFEIQNFRLKTNNIVA